jgi:flagellar biosynthesis protein FliQ
MKTDLVMLSLMAIISGMIFVMQSDPSFIPMIIVCLFLFLGFRIFTEYHKKERKIQILQLPVSNLERFLSVFLRAFIYFPLLLIVFMFLGNLLVGLLLYILQVNIDFDIIFSNSAKLFEYLGRLSIKLYLFMGVLFFGSIFYKKNAGIKIGLLFFGVVIFTAILVGIMISLMVVDGQHITQISDFVILSDFYESIIGIIIFLFFIGLSYLRLTEEQA